VVGVNVGVVELLLFGDAMMKLLSEEAFFVGDAFEAT